MNKIKEFKYMSLLKKGELYSFLSTFQNLKAEMDKSGDPDNPDILSTNIPKENYQLVSAKLDNQISLLAQSFNKKTPSPQSEYLSEQRKLIHSSYRSIVNVIKANLRFKTNENYADILELSILLRKYSKITTANLKEITALADNFLTDISIEKYSDIIEKLSLSNWITIMTNANKKFKLDALKRSDTYEKTVSYTYKMKLEILQNYHNVEFCINALAFNEEFQNYDVFINSLNGVITDYIENLQRRITTLKNKNNNENPELRTTTTS